MLLVSVELLKYYYSKYRRVKIVFLSLVKYILEYEMYIVSF